MKIRLFNDTSKDWTLHAASKRGTYGENRIPAKDAVEFEVSDGEDVFVKIWNGAVMVLAPFRGDGTGGQNDAAQ